MRRIYIQFRKEFLEADESNWVTVVNQQILSKFNTVLPKTRERGVPKTPITLTDLLSHNLQADASFETEWYIQGTENSYSYVKGKNSKSYSAFSWLTPIVLSFYYNITNKFAC